MLGFTLYNFDNKYPFIVIVIVIVNDKAPYFILNAFKLISLEYQSQQSAEYYALVSNRKTLARIVALCLPLLGRWPRVL